MRHIRSNHSASDRLALRAGRFFPFLLITLILQVLCFPSNASAQTEVEGEVSGVWDVDGSPYIQVGAATVPEDQSLTILPGCGGYPQ